MVSPRVSLSQSTPSPATQLVRALLNFGQDDLASQAPAPAAEEQEHVSDLDNEDEEIYVGGVKAVTKSSSKGKEKAKQSSKQDTADQLSNLSLVDATQKPKKPPRSITNLLRSSQHTITLPPTTPEGEPIVRTLTSWKMADYAYKRDPCPFPTRARGLFTEKIEREGAAGGDEYRIIARGYDKFFNVNEVSWTNWDNISKHSSAPYELTLKSNGCIILISTLSSSQILVTSKHAIGASNQPDTAVSHSQRGEYWLEKHLEKVGKTKADLAQELWDRGLTAVAEARIFVSRRLLVSHAHFAPSLPQLCDDSFEEHVLAYSTALTGLHLHGLNTNTPILTSLPSSEVTSFANSWGLIPTPYDIFPSVIAVKTYCQTVESQGGILEPNGSITPVEGFVVRGAKRGGAVGEPFFWKVKYDEPYLMYREWRELTRKLLNSWPEVDSVDPKKVRNEQSRVYLWWVRREMQRDAEQFEEWKKGRGIIKTRERFLEWRKGSEAREVERELSGGPRVGSERPKGGWDKTLLVPIAVQGCGKTCLGLELGHLFGWGHVQSDDFHQKKSGPHFIKAVKEELLKHSVVYADKNNHQRKHRSDLVSMTFALSPDHNVRLIALLFPLSTPSLPRDKLHALLSSRIIERGDRHQTLPAGPLHEGAIWQFLGQYESFDPIANSKGDGVFDQVVEVQVEWEREEQLDKVLEELKRLGVIGEEENVGEEKRKEAVEWAKKWGPEEERKKEVKEKDLDKAAKKKAAPRYYGLSVEVELQEVVERWFADLAVGSEEGSSTPPMIWDTLKRDDRVEKNPHVTLVHELERKAETDAVKVGEATTTGFKTELWERYEDRVRRVGEGTSTNEVELVLGPRIAWDGRCMAVEVSELVIPEGVEGGIELPMGGSVEGLKHAHVTIGTLTNEIRPVEGKFLLESVLRGEKESREGGGIEVRNVERVRCRAKLAGLK